MSNLTGVVLSPGGTPITGTLYLQLSQDANLLGGACGGPAAVASSPPFIFNLQNGVIVGPGMGPFQVPGADCLTPSNLTYHMTVTGSAGGTVLEKDVIITGPSVDLGTLTPVAPLGPVTPGGQLSGDVIGPASFNTVVRLQSRYVAATAPADLQTLVWNQAAGWWEPRLLALTGGGAAGQVAFWSAGQILAGDNNLSWANSTKRLGIGTATPANPLTVKGASGNAQLAITVNGTNYGELYIDNNSDFTIRSTGHNIFLQPGGGNVGIGTITPSDKLQIGGGSVILDNGTSYKVLDTGGTARSMATIDAANLAHLGPQGGAYDLALHAGSATAVAYLKGVNFGIGTTNPLSRLSVAGTVEITSGSGGVIKFADGTTQATAATAGSPSTVTTTDNNSTNATMYPIFTSVAGGVSPVLTSSLGLTYNPSSGRLGAITVSGTVGTFGTLNFTTALNGPALGPSQAYITPYPGGGSPAFRSLVAGDLPTFGAAAAGIVGASGGGTTNFLRADGAWAAPGGGGGSGTVTSISAATGITLTPNPIIATGTIGLTIPVVVSSGGTGTTTAFTAGSVIFAGASGVYSQDNALFFWDDANNRLGIGTATPNALVDASDPNKAQYFAGMAARGKVNAFEWGHPNASGYGSTLGFTVGAGYSFVGFDCQAGTGVNTFKTSGVKASIIVGDNAGGMQLGSVASASADNQVLVPFVTVLNSGNVGIGTTTPGSLLTVNGTIEIAAGSGGVLKFADGTTQASAAAAGGTVGGSGATGQATFWSGSGTIAGDNAFWWDNTNKRLGIGTTGPGSPLTVNGAGSILGKLGVNQAPGTWTTEVTGVLGNDGIKIRVANGLNNNAQLVFSAGTEPAFGQGALLQLNAATGTDAHGMMLYNRCNGPMGFATNNVERGRFLPAGNLVVGATTATTATTALFDVRGDTIVYSANGGWQEGISVFYTGATVNGGGYQIHLGSVGAAPSATTLKAYFRVRNSGNTNLLFGNYYGGTDHLFMEVSNTNNDVYLVQGNGSVGIGTTTVGAKLTVNTNTVAAPTPTAGTGIQVAGADATVARVEVESFGAATAFTGRRANGTAGSLTAVTTDDVLAQLNASGYTNAAAYSSVSADVQLKAAEPFTTANQGAYIIFRTTLKTTATLSEKMRLTDAGALGIGTTNPQVAGLEVSGNTKLALDSGNGFLWIANSTSPTNYTSANYDRLGIGYSANVAIIQTSAAGTGTLRPLQLTSGGAVGIYIDTAGKVGCGIVPSSTFHVSGAGGEIRIDDTNATGAQWRILAASGATKAFRIYDQNLGLERLRIDASGYVTANVGFVGSCCTVPQNVQAGAYTLVIGDRGDHILAGAGVTVPASIFAAGDIVSIYNNTAGNITITQGASVTMYLAGTATTGNRTLAQRGIATLLCVASNTFVISGGGLT